MGCPTPKYENGKEADLRIGNSTEEGSKNQVLFVVKKTRWQPFPSHRWAKALLPVTCQVTGRRGTWARSCCSETSSAAVEEQWFVPGLRVRRVCFHWAAALLSESEFWWRVICLALPDARH